MARVDFVACYCVAGASELVEQITAAHYSCCIWRYLYASSKLKVAMLVSIVVR